MTDHLADDQIEPASEADYSMADDSVDEHSVAEHSAELSMTETQLTKNTMIEHQGTEDTIGEDPMTQVTDQSMADQIAFEAAAEEKQEANLSIEEGQHEAQQNIQMEALPDSSTYRSLITVTRCIFYYMYALCFIKCDVSSIKYFTI